MSVDDNDALNRFIGLGPAIASRDSERSHHPEHEAFAPSAELVGPSWLKTLTEQRDAANLEAETWSARATEAEAEVRRQADAIAALEKRIAQQQAMAAWRAPREASRGVISVDEINAPLTAENKRLTELVYQLNSRITQLLGDVDRLTGERDRLARANNDLSRQIQACGSMRSEIDQARKERDWFEARCKELSKDADDATQRHLEVSRLLEGERALIESVRDERDKAESRVHDLEMEAIEHSDDVTALIKALARSEDLIMVLRRTRARGADS